MLFILSRNNPDDVIKAARCRGELTSFKTHHHHSCLHSLEVKNRNVEPEELSLVARSRPRGCSGGASTACLFGLLSCWGRGPHGWCRLNRSGPESRPRLLAPTCWERRRTRGNRPHAALVPTFWSFPPELNLFNSRH